MPVKKISLCKLDKLAKYSSLGFDPFNDGRDTVFIVRLDNDVRAYKNDCPHWPGSPMAWKKDAYLNKDSSRIICAGHGAEFELENGLCLNGPCVGLSLQPLNVLVDSQRNLNLLVEE